MATLKTKIQLRRDTAENLKDVKLAVGEPGYATDTKKFVIGDNSTKFSDLKGRVMGPNASTDNALAKFDGTSGQIIQNSNATLSDAGQLKVVNWKDERYASNVAMSRWTTTAKEIIIYTKIKFVSSAVMPIVRLHGYAYGQNAPIELKIGFYIYNSAYTNMGAVSMGAWRPEIRLFKYTASDSVDYVAIGFIGTCYYGGFQVDVQAAALGTLDSNILTTGWSVSTFTTEGNVPAVGTDKSAKVSYKSTLANLTINGTVYNGSSNVTFNLAEADHNHDDDYLKEETDTLQTVTDRGATTTKAITTAGLTTTSGYVNITGTSSFSEGIRLHPVGNLSSVWWNATADKDYCTNGMWGITAYDYGYSDSAKKNTFRFRGPTSQTATSPTDQMWIDSTGLVTSRGGFAKSGSSDSYVLLAGGGTKAISDFQTNGNYVTYTQNNSVSVAGTNKTTYTYGQTAIFAPNGLIMGGTAAAAGLVTRGICGVSTPDATTGAADKHNLYLNFDGDNTWNPNGRGIVINAGSTGNDLGSGMYQYCAVRGDVVKAWVEAKGYITSSSLPTVNNGTLTIQRNGTTVATFTANQAGNTTANITDNDTLNTAGSTNDEAKLYLVGAKSQAASAQTYSDAEVYTQAGELNATSVCVAEHGQMKYDSTNQCIRFVIV